MQDDPIRIPLRARDGSIRAYALVDAEDGHLAEHRWSLSVRGYAVRNLPRNGGPQRMANLHREVLGLASGDDSEADHSNGDRLDCRRANLRLLPPGGNQQNRVARPGTTSRHRGVSWDRRRAKWRATGRVTGQQADLGRFDDELEAAEVARVWREAHMPFTNEQRQLILS